MNKNKNLIILIIVIILVSFIISTAAAEDNLRIKVNQRPLNLNPIYAANDTELMIIRQLFDNLVKYDKNGEIAADLVESWKEDSSASVFKFKLKKDVYFHKYKIDGKEVKKEKRRVRADDWKWSLEYLASPQNKSPYAELLKKVKGYQDYRQGSSDEISGIKVLDDYQLQIELNQPYAPFINNLTKEAAVVLPKEAVLNENKNFSISPVGTGAFREINLSENKVTLSKNKEYWKNNYQKEKLPYLNQIEIYFNDFDLLNDYQSFDLYQLNSEDFKKYNEMKDKFSSYQLQEIKNGIYYYLAVDCSSYQKNQAKIKNIKKNIGNFLKEEDLIEKLNSNKIISISNTNNQIIFDRLDNCLQCSQNSAEADFEVQNQELLDLYINNSDQNLKFAELINKQLRDIDLNIKKYNWADYLKKLQQSNLNNQLFIMSYDYQNKFDFIYDNFYSKSDKNYSKYQNSRLDNLVEYLMLNNNQQSKKRAYQIIEEILMQENPFLISIQGGESYLMSEKISEPDWFSNIYLDNNFEKLFFK
ncbi:MAG: ABC transporter substrate-binding protein [Halanaerobium sp.]